MPATSTDKNIPSTFRAETVLTVQRWGARMFSFTTTRRGSFRFENGQFVMLGLPIAERLITRAYSIVSPNYDDCLEYLSIVAPGGAFTPSLSRIMPGDEIIIAGKPTGTLSIAGLYPGRALYLVATGTGIAPFLSVIRDPETYQRFEKVVLAHSVRYAEDLAYKDYICGELREHEIVGDAVHRQFHYHPIVTRGAVRDRERIPALIENGRLASDNGLLPIDASHDRFMICGNPTMLADTAAVLSQRGFRASKGIGSPGEFVYERAFAQLSP
jgi:ferredoxin/flavodoxin---NADP+ reductase